MSALFFNPRIYEADTSGNPLAGGKIYFYQANSSYAVPEDVYSDPGLTSPITQPVTADASGRFAAIHLAPVDYAVVCKDSNGVTQWSIDPYTSATDYSHLQIGVDFDSGDATPNVENESLGITHGTTTLTNFINGVDGQFIRVVRGDADIDIANNSHIVTLSGAALTLDEDYSYADLWLDGSVWTHYGPPIPAVTSDAPLGWFNVQDYGALGDGTTDDLAAIHAARTAAGTYGTIYFPPCTANYKVTGNIAANIVGQTWIIASGATIKMVASSVLDLFVCTAASNTFKGYGRQVSIIDGNRAGSAQTSAIYLAAGADYATIEDLRIQNCWSSGIRCLNVTGFHIKNCYITGIGSGSNGVAGIFANTTISHITDWRILNTIIDLSAESTSTTCAGCLIRGDEVNSTGSGPLRGHFRGNTIIMPIASDGDLDICQVFECRTNAKGNKIEGNDFINGTIGCTVGSSGTEGNAIRGNNFSGNKRYGIEYAGVGSAGALIEGNYIYTPGGYGIRLTDLTDFTVTGNTIRSPQKTLVSQTKCAAISLVRAGEGTLSGNHGVFSVASTEMFLIEDSNVLTITGNSGKAVAATCRFIRTGGTNGTVSATGNTMYGMVASLEDSATNSNFYDGGGNNRLGGSAGDISWSTGSGW